MPSSVLISPVQAALAAVERALKRPVFGCRMCGQCVLHSTGLTCPMTCPKQLRNGPCGGVRADGSCEVKPWMRCRWVRAYERSRHLPWREELEDLRPPRRQPALGDVVVAQLRERSRPATAEGLAWGLRALSVLEERLRAGRRVVTAELPVEVGASQDPVRKAVAALRDRVDAISVTDNPGAHAHASALAVSALVREAGAEPIMNLACRDRNRLALQSELLGAAVHGIENVVCVTGDDVTSGDEQEARRVFDLDSPQLLSVATTMQAGTFLSGRKIDPPPRFFLGAVENPTAPPLEYRAERALKKVRAGARFFQLQVVFEVAPVEAFLARAAGLGLFEQAFFLPSICILRSARQLRYLAERVAGVVVPADVLATAEALPLEEQREHLLELAASLARSVLSLPWASGLHLIPFGGPQLAVELLDRLGPGIPAGPKELHGHDSRVAV